MRGDKHTIIFALPGNEDFAGRLAEHLDVETGEADFRSFPDDESFVRVLSEVRDKTAIAVCSLHHPNEQIMPLFFLGKTLKDLGAKNICLIAPYLGYMRQDKAFSEGEAITSKYFAELTCSFADRIVTADPHLHRRSDLSEIYSIDSKTVHAAEHISRWIKENLTGPVLIGPDSESEQWVREVAELAEAPFTVLEKTRHGDRDVSISVPKIGEYRDRTPVLVDDIISTARTMIETIGHLKKLEMKPAVCIGVHAVFAGTAFQDLLDAGAMRVATCNTIPHVTNEIDISDLFAASI